MAADVTHTIALLPVFSDTSNWTGRPVLHWMTDTQSRTLPPVAKSTTLSPTRSHPRSLLSIARLNNAKSRRVSASSSRARTAQTCRGRSGRFRPISRPLFHGGCGGRVAGSWILDMKKSPSSPPTSGIDTVPTHEFYPKRTMSASSHLLQGRFAAAQWSAPSPNLANAAQRTNVRYRDVALSKLNSHRTLQIGYWPFPRLPMSASQSLQRRTCLGRRSSRSDV